MFGGKEPVLPLLSSTARTVDSTGGDQRQERRPSVAAAATGGGGGDPPLEEREIQSTDELLYVDRLILPFQTCKDLQRLWLAWLIPVVVKGLELYLLVNLFREDSDSKILRDSQMLRLKDAPNTNCPMSEGRNVYSISADYFFSLSLMAAIYGACMCVNDIMFVGRGIIGLTIKCKRGLFKWCGCESQDAPSDTPEEDTKKWIRLGMMCACNLALHFFCLYSVANSVSRSTSVVSGVANFAVIFIVLELDQKVAESLALKALAPPPKKTDEPPTATKLPPSNEVETPEDKHARKVMTLAQRIELMVRMVLFCGTVAIYIWYSYNQWFQCPMAAYSYCSGLPVMTFNRTAYVHYQEDLYSVTVENNSTVVWEPRPGKDDDYATRLQYWCAENFETYNYEVKDGQLVGPIWGEKPF